MKGLEFNPQYWQQLNKKNNNNKNKKKPVSALVMFVSWW
jgi:hypothetical protein